MEGSQGQLLCPPSTKRLGAVDCGVVMQGALQLQAVYAGSPEPLPMILLNKPYPHASSSTVLSILISHRSHASHLIVAT